MNRPGLLVSVRSATEALAALDGGADLIDVKEPSRGPLGSADFAVVESIVDAVAGRTPVSVALGEWRDWRPQALPHGLSFAKWGLSRSNVGAADAMVDCDQAIPVLVAYADYHRAESPPITELVDAACDLRFRAFLIDTAIKDGAPLLEWVSMADLERIRFRLTKSGVRFALAGSLDIRAIQRLAPVAPDWFAVRGAACEGGRNGAICVDRVRQLKEVIAARNAPAFAS